MTELTLKQTVATSRAHLTGGIVFLYIILLLASALSTNAMPSVVATSVAFLLYVLLWNESVPSVLFFALMFQWVAVSIKVFYGNWIEEPFHLLPATYYDPEYVLPAFYYSSIGLCVVAVALRFFNKRVNKGILDKHLALYDTKKLIIAYLIGSILLYGLQSLRLAIPGLAEAIANFVEVKWGLFVVLVYKAYTEKKYTGWVNLLLIGEVVLGFASFFSSFKVVLIFAIIAFFWYGKTIKLSHLPVYILIVVGVGYLGIVWTAVKGDYREFLSGGIKSQKVTVGKGDALGYLLTLVNNIEEVEFEKASYSLVDRIGYLDFFSLVIKRVPELVPHQEGMVWGSAISHILKPRIFFPNKASVDDSEHTRIYAGALVANQKMGASHSLGYMVDSYIDYGPLFMFIPIFLFGLFGGWVYHNLLFKSYNFFWGLVLSVPLYSFLSLFERNSLKIFSQLVMYFLVMWLFRKFMIRRIEPYLLR
jgi:hypothetical protein